MIFVKRCEKICEKILWSFGENFAKLLRNVVVSRGRDGWEKILSFLLIANRFYPVNYGAMRYRAAIVREPRILAG